MTDITELAQSLKAAANTTSDAIDRLKAFPGDELIDLSQHEGEQVDIDITMINEWYELSSPANILALLEALEKAQSKIIELQQGYEIDPRNHEIIDLHERIAELESRTVTVKMPKPHAHLIWIQAGHAPDDYWDDVAVSHSEKDRCCDGSERYPVYARWEIEEMLTAAGIKVEAE
ncbi:TPA: hypothetical protein ACNG1K_002596 [Klebsiella pneumoniae]